MKTKTAVRQAHANADPECPDVIVKAVASTTTSNNRQTNAVRIRNAGMRECKPLGVFVALFAGIISL
ncbi:MAG TPA: hypothetical protein VGJ33_19685 [Candidatus Angelobacter sp.]|jgi:hypothetical protein